MAQKKKQISDGQGCNPMHTFLRPMAGSSRSPNEKKSGVKASSPHFLFQLAAALDNPNVKSLEWHEDGKGILLHAKLYEDEIQRHQDLFPELKTLKSVSVLQAWLATYGFKARAKTDSDILVFQHSDFKKIPLRIEEAECPKTEVPSIPKQPKKSKKRKTAVDIMVIPPASTGGSVPSESAGSERKSQRLRPLYQYINYDNPEMNSPSDKDCDPPQPEVLPTLETKTGLSEPRITPSKATLDKGKDVRSPICPTAGMAPKAEVDKSTQVAIDKMLSVCAAHLVPPLSPQLK